MAGTLFSSTIDPLLIQLLCPFLAIQKLWIANGFFFALCWMIPMCHPDSVTQSGCTAESCFSCQGVEWWLGPLLGRFRHSRSRWTCATSSTSLGSATSVFPARMWPSNRRRGRRTLCHLRWPQTVKQAVNKLNTSRTKKDLEESLWLEGEPCWTVWLPSEPLGFMASQEGQTDQP